MFRPRRDRHLPAVQLAQSPHDRQADAAADRAAGAGAAVAAFEQARGVLDYISANAERAPDELWMDPVLECDAAGTRQLMLNVCHCGTAKAARKDIEPLQKAGKTIRDTVAARPFVAAQSDHDGDSPRGIRSMGR